MLTEVMQARASFYRLLSRLFLEPLSEEDIDKLVAMDFVSQSQELNDGEPSDGETNLLVEGFNDMGRGLRRRHSGTRTLLSTDFTMTFDGIRQHDGKVAAPYASVFLSKSGELYQEPRNEVYMLFLASGLTLREGVNLPEDHIAFEFEYLAILADRCADALAKGDTKRADLQAAQSKEFLEHHLLTWYPLFYDVASHMLETRFYRGVIKAAWGYMQMDVETLSEILEPSEESN